MKVLVVDDLADSRLMLKDLLEGHGHRVLLAEEGHAALEIARGESPDLVVSDVLMPGMDGFELCRRLRSDPELGRISFVFYTANFLEPEDERLALDMGADLYVRKPTDPEALIGLIESILRRPRGGGSPPLAGAARPGEALRRRHDQRLSAVLLRKVRDLESTERVLATLIGNLPGFVYRCRNDPDWTMEFVSERSLDLTGYPPEALLDNRELAFGQLIHPDDRERVWREIQTACSADLPFQVEYRIRRRDGSLRWVWEQGRCINPGASVERLEGYIADITEQRRAEAERNRFFELSLDMLCVAGMDGYFKQLNPAWSRVLGWSEAQLLAQPWIGIVHPDDRDATKQACVDLGGGQRVYTFENRFRHRDGSDRWLSWNLMPLPEEGLLYGVARDVTEQKGTELQLKRLNRALLTLSEGNRALVHVTDEAELLRAMCRIAVEEGGYLVAWVGYVQGDRDGSIKPMASYGLDVAGLDHLPLTREDLGGGQGPADWTLREGTTRVVQDIESELTVAPWRDACREHGCASMIVLPLAGKRCTMGILVICAAETNAFAPEEIALLEELANDLAYGIASHRGQAEALAAEKRQQQSLLQIIQAIALTVEKRDPYTAGHQKRVAQLVEMIAEDMGLPQAQIDGLRLGAMIHDIGKIYVPAEILNRPGRLTVNEFGIIKMHPEVGFDIVKDVDFPWPIAQMIHQHHERLDGSGYPQGLNGDEILLEAQIMAVADVVEAISSHRPYRPALGADAAIEEIVSKRGIWFNPDAVDACVRVLRAGRFSPA